MYQTEQENFWAGSFGDEYMNRNRGKKFLASKIAFWTKLVKRMQCISSCMELGSNIGLNLMALKQLIPELQLYGVEINKAAAIECSKIENVTIYNESILEFQVKEKYDLVFTSGVLIHINPAKLPCVYEKMYNSSSKYIVLAEYYSPFPVEVNYRGYKEKLFKRDFGGEMLGTYKDLKLLDYGFCYHGDPNFPLDDITWFILEKKDVI